MRATTGAPGTRTGPAASAPAIIAALASERRALERGGGRAGLREIAVLQSGPGPEAAGAAAAGAVARGAPALMSWGLAAGLAPTAIPGSVILPARIVAEGHPPIVTDGAWLARLQSVCHTGFEPVGGDLAGIGHVIVSAAEKAALAAASGAVATDMESYAIGDHAARAGVPFVAVRVVVDAAGDRLPEDIAAALTTGGDVRPLEALLGLLRHPLSLPQLMRLARRSALAHGVLEQLAGVLAAARFGLDPAEATAAGLAS